MANTAGVDTTFAERYVIERELGRGGAAIVYLARDLKFGRDVAIKMVRPELTGLITAERFLREITVVATLQHPHIVPVYDSGDALGTLYYVMPFVRGESLRQQLGREGQLPVDTVVSMVRMIASAVQFAHESGVLHRDIKPENILIQNHEPLLADFGLALAFESARDERLTETGLSMGTPHYMSPEQAAGERGLTPQTDIYSLGAVAYEMLVGEPPHTGASARAILARVMTETPRAIRSVRAEVPRGVERAVLRALAKAPADRFSSVEGFARALETDDAPKPEVSDSGVQRPRDGREPRRHRSARWITVAIAALLLVAVSWWTTRRPLTDGARIHALAVLPLTNLMGVDQEYFVEGMHDALISELSRIGALNVVISRTSVIQYKSTSKSIPEIAKELGVDALVEGSVFRSGDSVRIWVQVIGAHPREHHLWAGTFDGELRNALALQRSVVSAIAAQMRVSLTPREQARLATARPVNPEAYQLYLKASQSLYPGEKDLIQSLEDLRRALTIDSTFAPAYAGLARAYTWLGAWGSTIPPEAMRGPARTAALQAIAHDSMLADGYIALGHIKWLFDWDWAGADAAFQRGMALNPASAAELYTYADYLTSMGRFDEALAVDRRAVQLDPLSPVGYLGLNLALMCQGRYPEASEQASKLLAVVPNSGIAHHLFAEAALFQGHLDEAARHTERAEALWRAAGDRSWFVYLVWGYGQEHRRSDALRVLREMDRTPAVFRAVAYAGLSDTAKALDAFEEAYNRHEVPMVYVKVRHVLDPIRNQPRFQRVLRRMNFPQ